MEKITHQGKMIEVVQKEIQRNGESWIQEFARRSPGVRLIIPKGDKIVLSKEFRHEINGYDYRLPGGKVFDSLSEYNSALQLNSDISEAAKNTAIKEAKEEAGIEVKDISFKKLEDVVSRKEIALIVESSAPSEELKVAIENILGYELNEENSEQKT